MARAGRRLGGLALGLLWLLGAVPAQAGGGPETVLVVANADSPASLAVANAYVALRGIPPDHLCRVHGVPTLRVITVQHFRERLWPQVLAHIEANHLAEEIDAIAWSVDFPYGVDYAADFEGAGKNGPVPRIAALTGFTYLWRRVMERDRNVEGMEVNKYFRAVGFRPLAPVGFKSAWRWRAGEEPEREPEEGAADRYHLATLLGFTGEQGNTVPEVLACIERATKSDGTHPKGTVYLMKNGDVRSRTREPLFQMASTVLANVGGKAEILEQGKDGQDGAIPLGRTDVMGLVAGIAAFQWPAGTELLPGAIAEHLTSFGAMFNGSGQTKISEFVRNGAAGTSGTVAEPLAIPNKFPSPLLHAYYRQGASLAEAFYQSVHGPYQLLVLGDPLARPYARFAKVALAEPDPATPWSGTVAVKARVEEAPGCPLGFAEVWVDGQRLGRGRVDLPLEVDTRALDDGPHVLRLVVEEESGVGTRSALRVPIVVKNGEASVTIKGPRGAVDLGEPVQVSGRCPGAKRVRLLRGAFVLGEVEAKAGGWKIEFPADLLGPGTSEVFARAEVAEGAGARSEPVVIEVEVPGPSAKKARRPRGRKEEPARGAAGLAVRVTDGAGKEHEGVIPTLGALAGEDRFRTHLEKVVKGPWKRLVLSGEVEAQVAGEHQFSVLAAGKVSLRVGGVGLFEDRPCTTDALFGAMVTLPAGWHAFEMEYEPTGNGDLVVMHSGAQVAAVLAGKSLRH